MAEVKIVFRAKDLTAGVVGGIRKGLTGIENTVFSLKGALVGLGIGAVAKSFVNAADTSEQLRTRLGVLLGSVDEGNRLFKDMSKFASQVPFEYEEIMNSATMLSGILKGGVDEINQWMPLIGDLAATSGLSIQETTEQVQRMLSAGAASADKFRERGINAMLGFQAGVTYSAEETRDKLIEAWTTAGSKFRGATEKLATTWTGITSMLADAWFEFRNKVVEGGLFDFFKALGVTILTEIKGNMDEAVKTGREFSETIMEGMLGLLKPIGWVADGFIGLKAIWMGLKVLWLEFVLVVNKGLEGIVDGINSMIEGMNKLPGVSISTIGFMDGIVQLVESDIKNAKGELDTFILGIDKLPSEKLQAFRDKWVETFEAIRSGAQQTKEATSSGFNGGGLISSGIDYDRDEIADQLQQRYEQVKEAYMLETELLREKYNEDSIILADQLAFQNISEEQYLIDKANLHEQYEQDITNAMIAENRKRLADTKNVYANMVIHHGNMGKALMRNAQGSSRALFNIGKALSIARATMDLPAAVMATYKNNGGWPTGIIPAAIMGAIGALQINKIRSTQYQAHAGITRVPGNFTANLAEGERVLTSDQNRDLTNFLQGGGSGGVTIENMQIDLKFESIEGLRTASDLEIRDLIRDKLIPQFDVLGEQGYTLRRIETAEQL